MRGWSEQASRRDMGRLYSKIHPRQPGARCEIQRHGVDICVLETKMGAGWKDRRLHGQEMECSTDGLEAMASRGSGPFAWRTTEALDRRVSSRRDCAYFPLPLRPGASLEWAGTPAPSTGRILLLLLLLPWLLALVVPGGRGAAFPCSYTALKK